MKKLFGLFILAALMLIAVNAFSVSPAGYYYYWFTIVDEQGNLCTQALDIKIQDAAANIVCYKDPQGSTYWTDSGGFTWENLEGGYVWFWSKYAAVDVVITDGTNTLTRADITGSDNKLLFSAEGWTMAALTVTGTATAGVFHTTDAGYIKLGTGNDATLQFDGTNLELFAAAIDTPWAIGGATYGFDTTYYFETAGTIDLDYDGDNMTFSDAIDLVFGTDGDWIIECDTATKLELIPLTTDETSSVNIGADTAGADLKVFGATTGEYFMFDADVDSVLANCGNVLFTGTDAEANQFKVDATGTVAGFGIVFETTDGGVQINADGATNGDITIDAADIITLITPDVITIEGKTTSDISFEGTANDYETTLQVTDATADNALVLPDDSGSISYTPTGKTTKNGDNGAIPITHAIVEVTTGAASAYTLANGENGQILTIVVVTDGGEGTITPTTKTGWATAVLTDDIDGITLMYVDDTVGWVILGTFSDGTNLVAITQ